MNLSLPFPTHPLLAGHWAWSWRTLALRRGLHRNTHPDDLYEIAGILCDRSPETHVGSDEFAVDFLVPDETPIFACAAGEVVAIKDDGYLWGRPGSPEQIRNSLNFITLRHLPTPEFPLGFNTQYCHVARESARALGLTRGSQVKEGQRIGIVGKNGWTTGDHLHVMAYHFPLGAREHQSIPIQWK